MTATLKSKLKNSFSSHVRFSSGEYQMLTDDSAQTGESIPQLLKEAYFNGPREAPLISKPDLAKLAADLGRIGGNVNQIARRLNSGVRFGFHDEISEVQKSLDLIWVFLASSHCRCKRS